MKPFQKSDLVPAIELAIGRFQELSALADEVQGLEEQLETRKVVDRAKGILMDRHGLTEQDAFSFIQKRAMAERPEPSQRCQRPAASPSERRAAERRR